MFAGYLDQAEPLEQMGATATAKFRWPLPFPGGIKVPHLHYLGRIYFLETEQWQEFSQTAIKQVQEKLALARTVSFGDLMDLTEVVNELVVDQPM